MTSRKRNQCGRTAHKEEIKRATEVNSSISKGGSVFPPVAQIGSILVLFSPE
jgi:hypothetical protein